MIKKTLLKLATLTVACVTAIAPLTTPVEAQASSEDCDSLASMSWRMGQTGNKVVELQDCLTATGHFSFYLGSTGYYGPITQAALASYNTGYTPPAPVQGRNCDSLASINWYMGQRGDKVVELQDCLTYTGHYSFYRGSTGYYGPITQAALASYNLMSTEVDNNTNITAQAEQAAAEQAAAEQAAAEQAAAEQAAAEQAAADNCDNLLSRSWSVGDSGDDVSALQECLTQAGEYGATGYFGPLTQAALRSYNSISNPPSVSATCDALLSQSWSIGDRGSNVEDLQDCLALAGEYGSTGYFGPLTQAALASYNGSSSAQASLSAYYGQSASPDTSTGDISSSYTSGVPGNCDSYRSLLEQYSGWNVDTMMYAMWAESGCNPNAVGDQYVINGLYAPSCGLLQVRTLAGRPSCEALKDPATNVATSYQIWLSEGYGAWSTLR